jgi:hypothetical protein
MIMLLYLIEKPGEVRYGRPIRVNEPNVNLLERWGGNAVESVQSIALAFVAETC